MHPILKVLNLETTFSNGTRALRDVSFEIYPGEFTVILGPSGSGKTTLFKSLTGLIKSSTGTIHLENKQVSEETINEFRKKIGMIFQGFDLVGNISVLNNVLTGLLDDCGILASLFYLFKKEQKLIALECLDQVELLFKAYSRTDQLSGGQQQRVGIARAIAKKPTLLLADEPVASLDPITAFNTLSLLKEICVSHGITVLCSLHQVDLALKFSDRIIGLVNGRIIMDKKSDAVDMDYIQSIYSGQNQEIYFDAVHTETKPRETVLLE